MAMEDTNISKLYKDFESIPSLCLYDVTVFYQGERKELSQTSFTTRLLVVGQAVRVEQCTPSVSADSSHRHEAGNIFPIPSTPTSFAIYIGFQNPEQEGTLLEAKFQQSPFAEGGYTWDIAGNKSQNEFGVSLEVHFLSASPQRRVDISYKTKTGTTSLRIFPSSGDNGESPDAEEHFLQKLIDSPLSRARADTLLLNGLYLCAQFEQTNRIQYLDLSIQALSAGQPYTQGYFHECDSVPYVFFCHLLFIRCTLPHGAAFVDKAFDALASLESIPTDSGNGFLEPFVKTVLMVTGNHNCPEHYYTIALNVSTIHYMLTTSCMKRGHNNHGFMDKSTVARLSNQYFSRVQRSSLNEVEPVPRNRLFLFFGIIPTSGPSNSGSPLPTHCLFARFRGPGATQRCSDLQKNQYQDQTFCLMCVRNEKCIAPGGALARNLSEEGGVGTCGNPENIHRHSSSRKTGLLFSRGLRYLLLTDRMVQFRGLYVKSGR